MPLSREPDRMVEIQGAFNRVFKTRDGEVVLQYLEELFYDCQIKDESMSRQIGRRDVIHFVKRLMEKRDER